MKKLLLIILALAIGLCLPLTAQAKTEFELGGLIRLDAWWASTNTFNPTFSSYSPRNNVNFAYHGKLVMSANASRFNFTIKGPELWGGRVVGFIECDFYGADAINAGTTGVSTNDSSFNQAKLRLRHAMFKIIWPDRELLIGQYWSINSELLAETTDMCAYSLYGATQLRIPQVRYTQKFAEYFDASLAIESPQNGFWGINVNSWAPLEGETSEVPMVEAKVRYERDLYGKAAFYGKPRGFYVGLGVGYFRSYNRFGNAYTAWNSLGQDNYFGFGAVTPTVNNRNADHWLVRIENFTPIIPTTNNSLAGTLSLAQSWWIGQGVSAWKLDFPANDRYYTYAGGGSLATLSYTQQFIKRYGGFAQLQYYWTEEIYTNINFGFDKAFGFDGMQRNNVLAILFPGQPGYVYANGTGIDPINSTWRAGITQWYRPIPAVKFGLQYSYFRNNFFQATTMGSFTTNYGNTHTVMANAWYMF